MAEHETTADIIAWLRRPREGENAYLTLWRDEIADRIEAAHKRERGNFAALREAVEKIRVIAKTFMDATQMRRATDSARIDFGDIKYLADAALSAPPRNCDRFTSAEEAWDAYDAWVESYRAQGKTEPFNEFGWLYAEAQEGGANG